MESSKIYTIHDFFHNKDKIYKHCLVLNKNDVEKANDLFGETTIRLLEILDNTKFESTKRFIFFCGKVASNVSKEISRANKNIMYLEDIHNNKINDDEEDEKNNTAFEIPVEQHYFTSFEENPDIYYITKNLSYLEKRIIQELYNGYTIGQVAYRFKLKVNTIDNLLKRFDGLKFNKFNKNCLDNKIKESVDCQIIAESNFKDNEGLLEFISNKKHKNIYARYLNNQSLDSIAKAYNTTRSAVGVTIKRINDKLRKEGFYVNKRGQGGGRKIKGKA